MLTDQPEEVRRVVAALLQILDIAEEVLMEVPCLLSLISISTRFLRHNIGIRDLCAWCGDIANSCS
jgi:hypothetical protein